MCNELVKLDRSQITYTKHVALLFRNTLQELAHQRSEKSANFSFMLTFCIDVGVAIVRVLCEEERVVSQAL